jgi:hypothetical protein
VDYAIFVKKTAGHTARSIKQENASFLKKRSKKLLSLGLPSLTAAPGRRQHAQ